MRGLVDSVENVPHIDKQNLSEERATRRAYDGGPWEKVRPVHNVPQNEYP